MYVAVYLYMHRYILYKHVRFPINIGVNVWFMDFLLTDQITYLASLSAAIMLQKTCSVSSYSKLYGKDVISSQLWFK